MKHYICAEKNITKFYLCLYLYHQETARSTANRWAARNPTSATNQEVTRRNWKKNWFY